MLIVTIASRPFQLTEEEGEERDEEEGEEGEKRGRRKKNERKKKRVPFSASSKKNESAPHLHPSSFTSPWASLPVPSSSNIFSLFL